jgi:hypothetical protein
MGICRPGTTRSLAAGVRTTRLATVIVHVHHPRAGCRLPSDLMHVPGRGNASADGDELPYAGLARQEPHRALHERPGSPQPSRAPQENHAAPGGQHPGPPHNYRCHPGTRYTSAPGAACLYRESRLRRPRPRTPRNRAGHGSQRPAPRLLSRLRARTQSPAEHVTLTAILHLGALTDLAWAIPNGDTQMAARARHTLTTPRPAS